MKTVLIADDEPRLRLLVAATLVSSRCRVLEADDGDEAWEIIQRSRPDIVLLDVQMPGRSGLDLARTIKGDSRLASTRVVLLSGYTQEQDVQAGIESGADLYVVKPFSPIELRSTVEAWLGIS